MNRNSYKFLRTAQQHFGKRKRISKKRVYIIFKKIFSFTLFLFFVGIFYFAFSQAKIFFERWEFLRVKEIKIHAENPDLKRYISEKVEGEKMKNIIFVNPWEIKKLIIKNPYVKNVKIKKVLPSTIEIFLKERKGIALLEDGECYIVDEEGEIIKKVGSKSSLPVIKGASLKDSIAIETAVSFIKELKINGQDKYIEELDISNPFNLWVKLKNSKIKLYLGESDFYDKLKRFLAIEKNLRQEFGEIEYAGFYDRERVYVKMLGYSNKEREIGSLK